MTQCVKACCYRYDFEMVKCNVSHLLTFSLKESQDKKEYEGHICNTILYRDSHLDTGRLHCAPGYPNLSDR